MPQRTLPRRTGLEILFFGFVRPYKGLDVLIDALTQLPDRDFRLTIAGEFWSGEAELRARIAADGLGDRIEIRPRYHSDEETAELFARADCVALPYRSASGSGVLAVAYHYNKPVVVTRVGGLPEVVEEGRSGFIVEPGDAAALAGALERCRGFTPCPETMRVLKQRMSWDSLARALIQPGPAMDRSQQPRLRVAVLGSRGIPAEFGGFETFAEQLAVGLVRRGCKVTVFCEAGPRVPEPQFKGVDLRHLRTPKIVGLRSIWSDLAGTVACLRGYDVVYMLGYHAAFVFLLPRLFGVNFWVNMDGLEWRRAKWSGPARAYLRFSERLAARLARHLVADARAIGDHLASAYPASAGKIHVLAYGAVIPAQTNPALLAQWGLQPGSYDLVVCRLEPENHVLEIIQGHSACDREVRLVVVGDHRSGTGYVEALRRAAGPGVAFIGTVFDAAKLTVLRQHCRSYLHGHSVGGTNPSLLEAMACGNFVIAHDNPFNREVLAGHGRFFADAEGVADFLAELDRRGVPADIGAAARSRVAEHYDWERLSDAYLERFTASMEARP